MKDVSDVSYSVAVCDSQPMTMEGIRYLLEECSSFRVTIQTQSIEELDQLIHHGSCDIALIDYSLCGEKHPIWNSGIFQKAMIIFWVSNPGNSEILNLIRIGARGVLSRTATSETFFRCISAVTGNQVWIESALIQEQMQSKPQRQLSLTNREKEIVALIARGMKNREIAFHLGICDGTVKVHLRRILKKTGKQNRYHLALTGLPENSLIS